MPVRRNDGALTLRTIQALVKSRLSFANRNAALKRLVQLSREILGSAICSITLLDRPRRVCWVEAISGIDPAIETLLLAKSFPMGPLANGFVMDLTLLSAGDVIEKYGLDSDGQGIARPNIARRHNIRSLLAWPLESHGQLLGYINHFTDNVDSFSHELRSQLCVLACYAVIALESFDDPLSSDCDAVKLLLHGGRRAGPSADFLANVAELVCSILCVDASIIWTVRSDRSSLCIAAASQKVDPDFRAIALPLAAVPHVLGERRVGYLRDARQPNLRHAHSAEVTQRGWVSLLTAPMYVGQKLVGMLDIYTGQERLFTAPQQRLFQTLATHVALAIEQSELATRVMPRQYASLRALIDDDATPVHSEDELTAAINLLVQESADLTNASLATLHILNSSTQELEPRTSYGAPTSQRDHLMNVIGNLPLCWTAANTHQTLVVPNTSGLWPPSASALPASLACIPIISDGEVLGILTLGAAQMSHFTSDTEAVLSNILDLAPILLRRAASRRTLLRIVQTMTEFASEDDFLRELSRMTLHVMKAAACAIWTLDKDRNGFVLGTADPSATPSLIHETFLPYEVAEPALQHDSLAEPSWPPPLPLAAFDSSVVATIRNDTGPVAFLQVFFRSGDRRFTQWDRELLTALVSHATVTFRTLSRRRVTSLVAKHLADLSSAETEQAVYSALLGGATAITRSSYACILKLDKGVLQVVAHQRALTASLTLGVEEGITGRAVRQLTCIRLDDTRGHPDFQPFWSGMKSELTVPVFLRTAKVRARTSLDTSAKCFAVVNVESPQRAAFTAVEEEGIDTICQFAASALERIEFDRKLTILHQAETEISRADASWEVIVNIVLDRIVDLDFPYVNMSLITSDQQRIKTEYLRGLPPDQECVFKATADHMLSGNDIQACIVRSKQVEVPGANDLRYDPLVHEPFQLAGYVRVFIPMLTGSAVLGTVEAGVPRAFRNCMFEKDIQVLKSLVDYATSALVQRRRGLLDRIGHEFKDPIRGILSNAVYLHRKWPLLPEDKIRRKLEDIQTDCTILQLQVGHLEYFLGRRSSSSRAEDVNLMRDVVIKTILQFEPLLSMNSITRSQIEYDYYRASRVSARTDKAKAAEVFSNLFTNALKYADPKRAFRMRIDLEEEADYAVLKVKDWGIGINPKFRDRIFESGFRAPEAVSLVQGSGLGLSVARNLMRELHGDLILASVVGPTEFRALFPRRARDGGIP